MSPNADLKFGRERRREKPAAMHIPYLRHDDDNLIVTKSGFLVGVVQLSGLPFQTMDQAELNSRMFNRNTTFRNLSTSRFAVYTTIIRRHVTPEIEGDFDNSFVAELDARYMDELGARNLFVNEAYLTVIRRPMLGRVGWVDKALNAFRISTAGEETREEAMAELRDVLDGVVKDFTAYGARLLGVVKRRDSFFSEPAEFLAKILAGGVDVEMPLPRMSLGNVLATRQLFFGKSALELRGPGAAKLGAMVSIKEYPPFTAPGSLDGLLRLPHEFVLTQSFAIEDRVTAMRRINTIANQVEGSDEAGTTVEESVHDGADKLAGGEVIFGQHHMSVMALAPDMVELNRALSDITAELSRMSIVPVRETLNTELAFWAQLPGNFSYIARRALISSLNFAGLFSGHNFPSGQRERLHWKRPIALLETTSQTAYYFNFHVHDVGHFTVFGPTGSGKTVVLSFLMAQAMRIMPRPRCVYFDYMRGAEIFVRALGGRYEVMEPSQPTGFAPLQLDDTAENRSFLEDLLIYILTPEGGALDVAEMRVINAAVDMIYKISREQRTFDLLPEVLRGSLMPGMNDLAARIQPWLDPKDKGWLFNNPVDLVDFSKPVVGFDMTRILGDKKLRSAALLYIFHRLEEVIDGSPIMLFLDEGWKLLDDEVFAAFINETLKTIRRRNGVVGFGTQTAEDVVNSSISSSLIEQTKTNIFFPNPKASKESYMERFSLTAKEFEFVRRTAKETRTFLVKHDSDSIVAKLDLSAMPDLIKVLSSNEANSKECARLRETFGDEPEMWLPYFCGWESEHDEAA
ncbi:VirB4 family type IV secretion system protein [Mesorhizobium sp. LNHC209A00]|uniref:VirB4 family type IV secretion system protein n=1 Tax=Mesorhizobium sp. LNHC209A00 TaxID=1287226 RepID=UPI0003CFC3DE|nr:VirB4 family type IV secretion system protein [Mesorhizobium sp. LNHC209A00]ESY89643.1 type VI secretion protein [Mesorhizobium sp. LNHC209A00]